MNNQLTSLVTSQSSGTPQLSLSSSSSTNPGSINFVFTQSNLLSNQPSFVIVESIYNPN